MKGFALACSIVVLAVTEAHAGPHCGAWSGATFAPAEGAELPVAPTIAVHVEDWYYNGTLEASAQPAKLRVTIDGTPVAFATRDVRSRDGTIRFVTVKSRRTGTLELHSRIGGEKYSTPYTIVKDWQRPSTTAVTVTRNRDARLGPYRWIGDVAAIRVDVPAIAFTVKWRRDEHDRWRTQTVGTTIADGHSEAWLGERMCGMLENIPLALLERGIELQVFARLPDDRELAMTAAVPRPFRIPPRPPGWRDDKRRE